MFTFFAGGLSVGLFLGLLVGFFAWDVAFSRGELNAKRTVYARAGIRGVGEYALNKATGEIEFEFFPRQDKTS